MVLAIALKPGSQNGWQTRQQVLDEVHNEVDTFGLVETNLNGVGEEEEQSDEDWDSLRPLHPATGIDHCVVNTCRCPGCKLRNPDLRH